MHFTFVARNSGGLFERVITCDSGKEAEVLAREWCDKNAKDPESPFGIPEFLHMGLVNHEDRMNEKRRELMMKYHGGKAVISTGAR
jgi:hypothetical protein